MKLKLLLSLSLIIVLAGNLSATHVQGGDLTYRCLGGNQYEITLALYRDCAGVAAPTTVSINYKSVSCGINQNVTMNRIAGTGIEVTPICTSLITQCAGGTYPGVQEYIYRGTVTLPPCSDWVLSYTLNARNNAINTILSPGSQNMYIEATLNNLAFPCNSSPTFTNRPVPFICVGQPFCFNNGSNDPNSDSLSYQLMTPLHTATVPVTYIAPYSATQPLLSSPPCTFNSSTGDMCVTPTTIQVTVFAVKVFEWRGGQLVGTVMRDIQVRTVTCTNNNPYLNGINNTGSYTMNACAGNPISFNIPSFDADAGQNLTLIWNAGIAGATFNPTGGTGSTASRPVGLFTWTPTMADVSNTPHCFTVMVKDNNCPFNGSQTYSFCITVGGFNTTSSSTNAICTSPTGSATVNITAGGVTPFTYNWSPGGQTTPTATGLTAGTYTCVTTDAVGCTRTNIVTVNATPAGSASVSSFANVTCNGANNGTITVSTTGMTAPLTYSWAPSGGSSATATGLAPGTYTCTITDANGCTRTATQTITQPAVLAANPTFTNVGCFGGTTGTATSTPSGGTAPYTYLWMPGAFTTSSISNLAVGTYTVTVTDSRGCTATGTANITQPPILSISSTPVSANCGQANGSASVTGSGGFAPYTWSWSNGQTGSNATGLVAGTYTVTITDINMCTQSAPVTIGNIAGPTATITSSTNVSCNGGNNGNATIGVTAGTPPFTYLWNNGQTTPTASNLTAGIYSVVATDAAGCSATTNITITQPTALVANAVGTNPLCFGGTNGSATASAVGGTPPYSYSWTLTGTPTTPTVTGLSAGTYTCTVTDANGCSRTTTVTLTNPPTLTTTTSNTQVSCFGGCNGTATATVSNGTAPYSYLWNNPTAQTTATATGLCAGSYTVSITDANGCTSQAVTTITQPTVLSSNLSSSANLTCYNVCIGFAQVTATGGVGPYSYNWLPSGGTSATATNLCAGTYTCTVTDSRGCTSNTIANITQPTQLVASVTGNDITCAGTCNGTGNISYMGGTPPYTFLWTPSVQTIFNPNNLCVGTHTATVTDANGCAVSGTITLNDAFTPLIVTTNTVSSNCGQSNGSACAVVSGGNAPYTYIWNDISVSQTACANNIPAGTYNVDVTDAAGCTVTQVANINDISAPTTIITGHTDLLCNGLSNATATTNISGGVPPYNVLWTPGGQTNANPTNLSAGVNTITVTDAAGCISNASVTIIQPPAINHAIASITNVSCYGICDGGIISMANGGTGTLTYSWAPTGQTTPAVSNMCSGSYTVTITDANGCTAADTAVIVAQPNALAITSSTVTNITCFGDNDGSIVTTIAGGTPFYTFTWTPNVSSAPMANALPPGAYNLTVTDQNGCIATQNYNITQPAVLTTAQTTVNATCSLANGSATATPNGGTAPYTYQWNDPALQTGATVNNVFAGNYNITVTDNHGCTVSGFANIIDMPGPTIDSVRSTPVLCHGGSTGTATVYLTAGLGTPPITYHWTPNPQSTPTATGLSAGLYNISILDANGCSTIGSVVVTEPTQVMLFSGIHDTICYGDTAQVYAQATGGVPGYTYTWAGSGAGLTGTGPHFVVPTSPSIYSVQVTDANGCQAGPNNVNIFVYPQLSVLATDVAVCDGLNVTISAAASGGNGGPYTYSWSNGPTGSSQSVTGNINTSPINYTVTASDGCSTNATDIATVTVNPGSVGVFIGSDTVGCEPLTVTFTAVSNNGVNYTWNFGDGSNGFGSPITHTFVNSGTYTVSMNVTTAAGCVTVITDNNYIVVNPLPDAQFTFSPNPGTSLSPTINFTDQSVQNITAWSWIFGETGFPNNTSNAQHPSHTYANPGTYTTSLVVTNQYGCKDSVVHYIEIKDDYVFYAPNAFTPDGDGVNDIFLPLGVGWDIPTFEMYIFDRWGNLIYFTDDYRKGWDGRANHGSEIAQMDVYVWKVTLKDNNGLRHNYIGHVTIVK